MANSIEVILNAGAGLQQADAMSQILKRILQGSGQSFHIAVAKGDELHRIAQEKAASDCKMVVAGGGDGTVGRIAQLVLPTGKPLGVLPLGTFNYFARNLRIPLDLEGAARVLLDGTPTRAPVLDLNGRLVLNNASIGIHPAVLLRRRKLYERWGRSQLNAYLSVLLTAFQRAPRLRVRLATDSGEVVRETPLVMACSNAYQMETFALAGLECLPTKKFALYVARMAGRATTFRLGLRVIVRQLRVGVDYEAICVSDVTIEPLLRRHLRVAVDGELERSEGPMRIRVAPEELLVMSPREQRPG